MAIRRDLNATLDGTGTPYQPEARTADKNGGSVDLQGCSAALVLYMVGARGITLSGTNRIDLELEHSDNGSSWTDVSAADVTGLPASTTSITGGVLKAVSANGDAGKTYQFSYVGDKRYIRPVIDYVGTHGTATPISVAVIKGHLDFSRA